MSIWNCQTTHGSACISIYVVELAPYSLLDHVFFPRFDQKKSARESNPVVNVLLTLTLPGLSCPWGSTQLKGTRDQHNSLKKIQTQLKSSKGKLEKKTHQPPWQITKRSGRRTWNGKKRGTKFRNFFQPSRKMDREKRNLTRWTSKSYRIDDMWWCTCHRQ